MPRALRSALGIDIISLSFVTQASEDSLSG